MLPATGAWPGLVLVDNSVGEEPPPRSPPVPRRSGPPPNHADAMKQFVRHMFRRAPAPLYLDRLTQAALRTPETASRLLLAYPVPRSYWKEAVYATKVPMLYVIRPRWVAQGQNLVRNRPDTEMDVFNDAGHALFVDEPARFNTRDRRFPAAGTFGLADERLLPLFLVSLAAVGYRDRADPLFCGREMVGVWLLGDLHRDGRASRSAAWCWRCGGTRSPGGWLG